MQSSTRVAHEPSHQIKTELATPQKAAIGKLAASPVQPESCIYLDAGTTTLAIAVQLVTMNKLTVVTNDFVIADYLMDNSDCTIIHTGGAVCRENRSCVGEAAATLLRGLMIDQAFISASSWSVRGISTPAEDKVTVKRAVASASRQKFWCATRPNTARSRRGWRYRWRNSTKSSPMTACRKAQFGRWPKWISHC